MAAPVNISSLSSKELKQFLNSFDHVFSDCDDVIWSNAPLPGSGDFFRCMESMGKSLNFVSNNSLRSQQNYDELFAATGISNGFERLTVPSIAIVEYLKSVNFDKEVYCVTCSETVNVLESNDFKCHYGPDIGEDFYTEYVQYLQDDTNIGAVVFDSDFKINLPKMYKAVTYLKRPDVHFLAGATDRRVPICGYMAMGTGIFTDLVADEVKREPVFLAKPGKKFGELAMRRAGVTDSSKVLFIGDMIEQDIGLGKACGFQTLLVMTSHDKEEMMNHKTITPDYYAESLGSIVPLITNL